MPYCRGREEATPSPSGTLPEMATVHVRVRLAARTPLVACLQGPPSDASEEVWPLASGIQEHLVGLNHPALRSAKCHRTPGGGQLVHVQRPGVIAADCPVVVESDLSSGDRARPQPERRYVLPEPRRASVLVHHQVSRVFRLVLRRVHRQMWVVWHLRSHQQGGAVEESTGPGLACPHLNSHPLISELRLFCRSGALAVRGHPAHWRRGLGPWA